MTPTEYTNWQTENLVPAQYKQFGIRTGAPAIICALVDHLHFHPAFIQLSVNIQVSGLNKFREDSDVESTELEQVKSFTPFSLLINTEPLELMTKYIKTCTELSHPGCLLLQFYALNCLTFVCFPNIVLSTVYPLIHC